jgi:hypothetical protein
MGPAGPTTLLPARVVRARVGHTADQQRNHYSHLMLNAENILATWVLQKTGSQIDFWPQCRID